MTHFERLGLPRRFSLDGAALEAAYLARSREVHPDYHAGGGDAAKAASLEASAALNDAYATLRDPVKRAEYLLALAGGPTASEARELPDGFLAEMFDLRSEIEALDAVGFTDVAGRTTVERQLVERRAAILDAVAAGFDRGGALPEVRRQLNALAYVNGLLRDLRARRYPGA